MRPLHWILVAVGALVLLPLAAVAIFVATLDLDGYKTEIAEAVERATGRKLVIAGRLKLDLFPRIELSVADLRFANAPGGSRPDMALVKRAELDVDPMELLRGALKVERLVLDGADILLETDKAGKGNWEIGAPAASAKGADKGGDAPTIQVDRVEIKNVVLSYRDGKTGETTTLALARLETSVADAAAPLAFALEGALDKIRFAADGSVGSIAALLAGEAWPVAVKAKIGDLRAAVEGRIAKPLDGAGLDLKITAIADDTRALGALAGADIPSLGALQVVARLTDAEGGYKLSGLAATLAGNDIGGEVLVKPGARLYVNAKLKSKSVDADKLIEAAGKPSKSPAAPARKPSDGRVIPDLPLPLDGLPTGIDMFLTYGIDALKAGGIAWKSVALDGTLAGGKLTVRKADLGYRNGKIALRGEIDGRAKPAAAIALRLNIEKLEVGPLARDLHSADYLDGSLESDIELRGQGKTLRALAASLDGKVGAVIGDAKIVSKMLTAMSADAGGALVGAIVGKGDDLRLNCGVVRATIEKGNARLDGLLFDTPRIVIVGTGTADLRTEALDLRLVPEVKNSTLVSAAVPVDVKGTMAEPDFTTDKAAAAKAAAGITLNTIFAPLSGLMPTAKVGTADRTPCAKAIQEAGVGSKGSAARLPAKAPAPKAQPQGQRRQTR